jgi:hypothetical protein
MAGSGGGERGAMSWLVCGERCVGKWGEMERAEGLSEGRSREGDGSS